MAEHIILEEPVTTAGTQQLSCTLVLCPTGHAKILLHTMPYRLCQSNVYWRCEQREQSVGCHRTGWSPGLPQHTPYDRGGCTRKGDTTLVLREINLLSE